MVKIPSIEADIKMLPEGSFTFTAGSNLKIATPSNQAVEVRVLDAFSSRKTHTIEAGDDAFVVFLLVDYPTVSYEGLKAGARFDIVDGGNVIGGGIVQARVE